MRVKSAQRGIQKLIKVLLDCYRIIKNKSCDLARLKVVLEDSLKSKRMEISLIAYCAVGVFISNVSSNNWLLEAVGCNP
jgi:hypothetical protein